MSDRLLVLLDVDGTLIDSAAMILAAQAAACAAVGLVLPPRAQALSWIGLPVREGFTRLFGVGAPIETMSAVYGETFRQLRESDAVPVPLFPGVAAALARLSMRDDVVLGIATGKSRRGMRALIAKEGWHDLFATVQTEDDGPGKPAPDMVFNACQATGIAVQRTLMVGDSSFDMQMARAAGARAIGVAWGFQPVAALLDAGAVHILAHMDALDDAVLALSAQGA